MKLDFNLQINQKQGLALTAQVQQAIKLLHMTNLEIAEFVETQFQDNPFVEESGFSEKVAPNTENNTKTGELDKSLDANPYQQTTSESKVSQENQFETGESYIPRSTVAKATSDFDAITLVEEKHKSLYAHCFEYMQSLELSVAETIIAATLIEDYNQLDGLKAISKSWRRKQTPMKRR